MLLAAFALATLSALCVAYDVHATRQKERAAMNVRTQSAMRRVLRSRACKSF